MQIYKRKNNDYNDYISNKKFKSIDIEDKDESYEMKEIYEDCINEIKLELIELKNHIILLHKIISQQNELLNSILSYNHPVFTEPPSYIN
jgi:hypothetical protein